MGSRAGGRAVVAMAGAGQGRPLAAPAEYALTELDPLGGALSYGLAINRSGRITGAAQTAAGALHAFLWEGGVMTDLGTLGGLSSRGLALSDAGHVVGAAETAAGALHAFLWEGGVMTDLGTLPGGGFSEATGVNASGLIVGRASSSSGPEQAVIWERRAIRGLGTLGGAFSQAVGVNDAGTVAVVAPSGTADKHLRALRWRGGAATEVKPAPGQPSLVATALNGTGAVVGVALPQDRRGGRGRGVLVEGDVVTDLGVLPGAAFFRPTAVNGPGQVVGTSAVLEHTTTHAVLWTRGVLIDLNDVLPAGSEWVLEEARGINDAGQIVGSGRLKGQPRGFLLSPRSGVGGPPASEA